MAPDRTGSVRGLTRRSFHRIAFADWGPLSAARRVLCVHGLTRNGRDFDHLAIALAKELDRDQRSLYTIEQKPLARIKWSHQAADRFLGIRLSRSFDRAEGWLTVIDIIVARPLHSQVRTADLQ